MMRRTVASLVLSAAVAATVVGCSKVTPPPQSGAACADPQLQRLLAGKTTVVIGVAVRDLLSSGRDTIAKSFADVAACTPPTTGILVFPVTDRSWASTNPAFTFPSISMTDNPILNEAAVRARAEKMQRVLPGLRRYEPHGGGLDQLDFLEAAGVSTSSPDRSLIVLLSDSVEQSSVNLATYGATPTGAEARSMLSGLSTQNELHGSPVLVADMLTTFIGSASSGPAASVCWSVNGPWFFGLQDFMRAMVSGLGGTMAAPPAAALPGEALPPSNASCTSQTTP